MSGFAGPAGDRARAFESVSAGTRTGHAEAVRVTYDPRVVPLQRPAADLFLGRRRARPTRIARGPTPAPQYRTALFPASAAQERQARAPLRPAGQGAPVRQADRDEDRRPTQLRAGETYHQDFMRRNPTPRLHRRPRPPQGRSAQAAVPEELPVAKSVQFVRSYKFTKVSR